MKVVTATTVVGERVEGSSLGHLVVKLAMYVWLHGDVASVPGAVQNSSSVWFSSVHKTWSENYEYVIIAYGLTDKFFSPII